MKQIRSKSYYLNFGCLLIAAIIISSSSIRVQLILTVIQWLLIFLDHKYLRVEINRLY